MIFTTELLIGITATLFGVLTVWASVLYVRRGAAPRTSKPGYMTTTEASDEMFPPGFWLFVSFILLLIGLGHLYWAKFVFVQIEESGGGVYYGNLTKHVHTTNLVVVTGDIQEGGRVNNTSGVVVCGDLHGSIRTTGGVHVFGSIDESSVVYTTGAVTQGADLSQSTIAWDNPIPFLDDSDLRSMSQVEQICSS